MYWTILLSVMMVALLQLVSYTRLKQNVLVVLGSADDRILSERVSAAIEYIESNEDQSIILFISGGVKNAMVNESSDRGQTEASKAASSFDYENVKIVLDEKATNTAENFAYLKRWVNSNFSTDEMPSIVITSISSNNALLSFA